MIPDSLFKFDIRPVPSAPNVLVSDSGDVFKRDRHARNVLVPRKQSVSAQGYFVVNVRRQGKSAPRTVHRLVGEAFLGKPKPGQEMRHLDGCRTNNRVTNLRWGTSKENSDDQRLHGTLVQGNRVGGSRLDDEAVRLIRGLLAYGISHSMIATVFGVSKETVSDIKRGNSWGWLDHDQVPTDH